MILNSLTSTSRKKTGFVKVLSYRGKKDFIVRTIADVNSLSGDPVTPMTQKISSDKFPFISIYIYYIVKQILPLEEM